jgi:glycine/D-amino acid oxidase-like deaminating enzyme
LIRHTDIFAGSVSTVRAVVVGAGAWGLPAAAELARRGHDVTLVDRYGPASQLMSSSGPTRLWRVSHPDRLRVRLALRSVEAWERLEAASGITALLRPGILWRDDVTAQAVADALEAEGVPRTVVEPDDVGRFFPGLRPDGRVAIWQESAGPLLARAALDAQAGLFAMARGKVVNGPVVREVDTSGDDVVLRAEDGREFRADVVVLAPGPGAGALFESLGIEVELRPVLEQVCHVGHAPDTDSMPCLYDGPMGDEPGMYAMSTPGRGYKLGIDLPIRDWHEDDIDRVPVPEVSQAISARVRRNFVDLDPTVLDAQVCSWTESPDGRFVIDRIADGRIVLAAGDSGEGFKFSALMGLVLADLAEGEPADPDIAPFSLGRFRDDGHLRGRHVLGR